ncbi:MAG TPA: hypothetical protein VK465_07010 [Fibrobacteria bacterium]|nr:hypothetical protein [Fibrobacteria bacterium]
MENEFMATYGEDSGPKELPSIGMHQAVCAQVHSLGFQVFKGQVSFSPKCVFVFELDEKMKEGQMAGKPFVISERHGQYMGKPGKSSNLRRFLEKWKGKEYTEEEAKATNIKKCEGQPCTLMIDHEPKDGGGFRAKIVGISRRDSSKPLVPITYTEVPKWIVEEKAKAVPPPNQQRQAQPQTAPAGVPPQAEDDLPF